jgi:hypothetical protein
MRRALLLLSALCAAAPAQAQIHGIAVQVSQGQAIPTQEQIVSLTNPGDFVRDLAPWSRTDPGCDLTKTQGAVIAVPPALQTLYDSVAATGRKNFLTLGFNNVACGQVSTLGWTGFPNTPELRAEFSAYAVQLVQTVPQLGGISIWNEMNGAFNGGYKGPGTGSAKAIAYCQLANQVITDVRKVNKTIPIAIGASVGWNIQGWVTKLFTKYGCMGQNDSNIWLDVHPFISGTSPTQGWAKWSKQIAYIRAHGINNRLIATEWGGSAAAKWMKQIPGGNYPQEFRSRIITPDSSWAGLIWFEAMYDTAIPKVGLIDSNGQINQAGRDYVDAFVRP